MAFPDGTGLGRAVLTAAGTPDLPGEGPDLVPGEARVDFANAVVVALVFLVGRHDTQLCRLAKVAQGADDVEQWLTAAALVRIAFVVLGTEVGKVDVARTTRELGGCQRGLDLA